MVTGGFRTVEGMDQALQSHACDVIGIARLMAIEPDVPKTLLAGKNGFQSVQPIKTGIKKIDSLGIMEVLWYTQQQLKRIGKVKSRSLRKVGYGHLLNQFYAVVGQLTQPQREPSKITNLLYIRPIKKHSNCSAFLISRLFAFQTNRASANFSSRHLV